MRIRILPTPGNRCLLIVDRVDPDKIQNVPLLLADCRAVDDVLVTVQDIDVPQLDDDGEEA